MGKPKTQERLSNSPPITLLESNGVGVRAGESDLRVCPFLLLCWPASCVIIRHSRIRAPCLVDAQSQLEIGVPQDFGQCSLCPQSYLSYLVEKQMDQRKMARGLEGTSQVKRWDQAICVDSRMGINDYERSNHPLKYFRGVHGTPDILLCPWDPEMRRTWSLSSRNQESERNAEMRKNNCTTMSWVT